MRPLVPDWLYFGSDADVRIARLNMRIVHAAKEPWHREAVGYASRAAPQGPERLVAERIDELYLNLVDVPYPDWIHDDILAAAVAFCQEPAPTLIHCNQGLSRGPWLAAHVALTARRIENWTSARARVLELEPLAKTEGSGMYERIKAIWQDQ